MNYRGALRSYFAGDHRTRLLLGVLVGIVVADGLISNFIVTNRFGVEANPFLQAWVGREEFLVIKLVGALLAALLLWDMHKRNRKAAFITTLCFVILYTLIVFWNLFAFLITQV
ncbi:DUF5658 family protein [Chloroflexota bacterium]